MVIGEGTHLKLRTKFVDRIEELKELKKSLEEVNTGKGKVIFVSGEAGIGKTRLIEELGNYAATLNFKFLKGRCLYHEDSDPYLPFLDALRHYLKASEGTEKVEQILPMGLLPVMDTKATGEEKKSIEKLDIQAERDRMFDTISRLIVSISQTTPLILFIDDLQWADNASLQLLYYIARNIKNSKVLLCGAYRPEDLEKTEHGAHPLDALLQRMNIEKIPTIIQIKRMRFENIAEMVKDLLDVGEVQEAFIGLLYKESEGNPFFVQEVLRALIEEGIIDIGAFVRDISVDSSKMRIPNTILDVISRRIARLDDNTKKVLMYGAIIGNQFSFDILEKVAEMTDEQLLDSIDKLINSKLIYEERSSDKEIYKFDHYQVRKTVYESLSKSRMRIMHRKVGEAIEALNKKNIDEVVYPLSRHFTIGKDNTKAYLYSLKAGEKATRVYALDSAIEYYQTALKVLYELPGTVENKQKRVELLSRMGEINWILCDWDKAIENYNQILKIGTELKEDSKRGIAYRMIAHIKRRQGEWIGALDNYRKSLEISESINDISGMADTQRGLGYVHWRRGQHEEAMSYYNQCLTSAMKLGNDHLVALTFIELGNFFNEKGEFDKAIDYYKKSIEKLKKIDDLSEMARAYGVMGDAYLKKKDWQTAIQYFEKGRELAEKIRNKDFIAWTLLNAGEAHAKSGNLEKAKESVNKALRLLEKVDDKVAIQCLHRNFGIIYGLEKNWNAAEKSFNQAVRLLEGQHTPYTEGETYLEYGVMKKRKGELKEAKEWLEKAYRIFDELEARSLAKDAKKELESLSAESSVSNNMHLKRIASGKG